MKKGFICVSMLSILLCLGACGGETSKVDNLPDKETDVVQQTPKKENVTDKAYEIALGTDGQLRKGTYTGEWENGRPSGEGVFRYTIEGETGGERILSGTFENDEIHGKCKVEGSLPDGGVFSYEGQMDNGVFNGQGKYSRVYADGDVATYAGEYKNGVYHGTGEYKYTAADGSTVTYSGEYRGGKKNGKGSYEYVSAQGNRKTYKGEFEDGKRSGNGTLEITEDGKTRFFEGEFKDDDPHGAIMAILPTSEGYIILDGQYVKGKPYGELKYTEYKNDKVSDTGVYRDGKYISDSSKKVVNIIDSALDIFGGEKSQAAWEIIKDIADID